MVRVVLPARPQTERRKGCPSPLPQLQGATSAIQLRPVVHRHAGPIRHLGRPPHPQRRKGRHHSREGCERRPRNGLLALPGRLRREGRAHDRPHQRPRDPRRRQHDCLLRRFLEQRRAGFGQRLGRRLPLERKGQGRTRPLLQPSRHVESGYLQRLSAHGRAGLAHPRRREETQDAPQRFTQVRVGVHRAHHTAEQFGDVRLALGLETGYLGSSRRGQV